MSKSVYPLEAALALAARGWPVFPCNNANKQPLLVAAKDPKSGKKIRGTGGVSKASTDPETIRAWWKKWPLAMIGLATGHGRLFVVDFDPRHDPETGEEWTLERLKAELEAQIGCALPATLAVRTPSGGVHLYFLWPDDGGEPIRNRGNLPHHVDVRGLGGYVIAPPSVMEDARRYRWLRGAADAPIAEAPAALVETLRSPKRKPKAGPAPSGEDAAADQAASASPSSARPSAPADDPVEAAVRRYALSALDAECRLLASTPLGNRNNQSNASGFVIGQLVGAGAISKSAARAALYDAVSGFNDPDKAQVAVDNGIDAGEGEPRDLSAIRDEARSRAARYPRGGRARGPAQPRARGTEADRSGPFRDGRRADLDQAEGSGVSMDRIGEADIERLRRIAAAWLARRLDRAAELLAFERKRDLLAIAWGIGRRAEARLIDEHEAREAIWPLCEDVLELTHAEIDQAIEDGMARGFDPGPVLADLKRAEWPMTDFGLGERFKDQHGHNFRFTTAKGWLGWDGRRWKVLDQDKDTPPAELISAVFETIRGIQREARRVAETGLRFELVKDGKQERLALDDPNEHSCDRWVPVGKQWKRFSAMLSAWGRQCEQAGKPAAIGALARRWLTVPIEEFDCEQMAINVQNGTLRFAVETLPDGRRKVAVLFDEVHRREDLITRIAPVAYDPEAVCPRYDDMIAWAQPDPAMRRYVHQVGGYSITGHTGEHKLWFNYGRGRNGKSTTIDSWCSALGDYSGTIGIESFLDQGIKKRGDQATPDLAKLGGVRMLRASEPERGAKLNAALIKAATGGEPMSVRALHRGFFDLLPRFKLLMSGNSKPSIPDTDEGIWGRMRLVPWLRHIEKPEEDPYRDTFPCPQWPKKDAELLDKIKGSEAGGIGPGELAGVFRRLVEGLVDYLSCGTFVEPEGVTLATAAYRDQSDPLARFLRLCTAMEKDSRVKSSELHAVFCAWCKAAGEKEWSQKGFSDAMIDKGFAKTRSDGMRWEGLRLTRGVEDFLDSDGNVKSNLPDLEAEAEPAPSRPPPADDPGTWFDDEP